MHIPQACDFPDCNKSFSNEAKLRDHQRENHNFYPCIKCKRLIRGRDQRNSHQRKCKIIVALQSQAQQEIPQLPDSNTTVEYACQIPGCGESFKTIIEADEHSRVMHAENPTEKKYKCEYPPCTKSFAEKDERTRHHRGVHKEYNCDKCNKTIVGFYKFDSHREKCGMQIACGFPRCGQFFNTKTERRVHQRTVHERPGIQHECPYCKKLFNSNTYLKRHVSNMHNEQQCKYCDKKFTSTYKLKSHMGKDHPQAS
ncbi:PR domain zinc finger protein 5-like protein [Leptotrombidium deliense]|uniref:PR domain zinc finger protein 5-like protein n=1 Tax=Leptotrombidium deliense TaxID=299467 RepID=A0A443RZU4_9ACAR|nr:PR domain zinc finger protein 5-like protein [Leptotrombidium deliense]